MNKHIEWQAIEQYYPFQNSTTELITIGTDICDSRSTFCNGPLKPGTTYRFKIRAFTDKDKFTDSFYSAPITTGIYNLNFVWLLLLFFTE